MKVFITSLNSKYIHSNLAIRYLYKYTLQISDADVSIEDFTINQRKDSIIKKIIMSKPDIVAFSIYIWNYSMTIEIVESIKKINPNIKIIVGGPEVSYDPEELLKRVPSIDYVIFGEGEIPFQNLIKAIIDNGKDIRLSGVGYIKNKEMVIGPKSPLMNIDSLIFPYDLPFDKTKLVYYESSRGCPYNCSYCISSTIKGVRYKTLDLVKKDLQLFLDQEVKIVKFIDRTFNIDKKRSLEIIKYMIDNDNGVTTFHLELSPNLIDEDWIILLKGVRKDLVQFEVGIQSVHENVIKAVNRNIYFDKIKVTLKELIDLQNIHMHVDLIAGLPYEGLKEFMESFDEVYALKADHFQLGFLKLLKGSQIRREQEKYGYIYDSEPPYEIFSNDFLSYYDLIYLKDIEELLENYYNSHHFENTIEFVVSQFDSPSDFYDAFSKFWNKRNLFEQKHKLIDLFIYLYQFSEEKEGLNLPLVKELMKLDYHRKSRYKETEFFGRLDVDIPRHEIHEMIKDEKFILKTMPQFKEYSAKEIIKSIQIMSFDYNVFEKSYQKIKTIGYFDYKNDKFGIIGVDDNNE